MSVNGITFNQQLQALTQSLGTALKPASASGTSSFENILSSYMNFLNETNTYQLEAEQLQIDFASGKTDDMLSVALAQEKATASLTFAVQVTNKIIEAYKEIMRTQL